jgi:hypothetical protein
MGLIQEHTMTEEAREARRRNGRQSRGAVSAEGKERSRAANLRHGLDSRQRHRALRALGEDPADWAALAAGAYDQWRPANAQQADLVERSVELQWRMNRAARRQEHFQVLYLEKVAAERRERVLGLRYHHQDMESWLRSVQGYAARPDFYATPGFIAQFQQAFGEEMQWRLDRILELLHALREPTQPEPPQPLPAAATTDTDWQEFLALDEEAGAETVARPGIAIVQGEERAELRAQLRHLAKQELEAVAAAWDPFFAKHLKPMTLAERDKAVVAIDGQLERLRREEESCLRQFWRTCNLLMKLQDRKERQEPGEEPVLEAGIQDVRRGPKHARPGAVTPDNVGPSVVAADTDPLAGCTSAVQNGGRRGGRGMDSCLLTPARKNAGATGDVIKNKGKSKTGEVEKGRSEAEKSASAARHEPPKPGAGGPMAA